MVPSASLRNRPVADEVTVDSGTSFHWKNIRCQLLGLREADDPVKRQQAFEFSRKWFSNIHYNRLGFYNSSKPLATEDGACVIWLYGDIYPRYRTGSGGLGRDRGNSMGRLLLRRPVDEGRGP